MKIPNGSPMSHELPLESPTMIASNPIARARIVCGRLSL